MSIEAGVQFLYAKVPIYKGFHVPFNDNRLYGDSEWSPWSFAYEFFNERSGGCTFSFKGCAHFNDFSSDPCVVKRYDPKSLKIIKIWLYMRLEALERSRRRSEKASKRGAALKPPASP